MTRVLVTGASGLLGGHLLARLREEGVRHVGISGLDLSIAKNAADIFDREKPDAVIHAAAMSAMADCARDPERARVVNVGATANVAKESAARGARLVHVSTDLVFDGERAPYAEDAVPSPVSTYGRTKADAEIVALAVPRSVVVRVSLLFGPGLNASAPRVGFFDAQIAALREGRAISLFHDEQRTPLALHAAAEALVAIARADASVVTGTLHLGGPERLSRLEMGERLARALGAKREHIVSTSRVAAETNANERRPRDVSLSCARFAAIFPAIASASLRPFEEECARIGASLR